MGFEVEVEWGWGFWTILKFEGILRVLIFLGCWGEKWNDRLSFGILNFCMDLEERNDLMKTGGEDWTIGIEGNKVVFGAQDWGLDQRHKNYKAFVSTNKTVKKYMKRISYFN